MGHAMEVPAAKGHQVRINRLSQGRINISEFKIFMVPSMLFSDALPCTSRSNFSKAPPPCLNPLFSKVLPNLGSPPGVVRSSLMTPFNRHGVEPSSLGRQAVAASRQSAGVTCPD